ncbi:MAG: Hsp20/alpha crystallin family protein [Acidobacteriia bacterium]|nr:Hsp20/alpha crystallin family protein [Terriglobia bacterium]
MIETTERKSASLLPVPFEEIEDWPARMQEFFDMIARRPFELLETRPRMWREFESFFRPDAEVLHPVHVRLFETDEDLVLHAEVPGFTEKDLNVTVEPGRIIIAGKREHKEEKEFKETKGEKKELTPYYKERYVNQIYRSVKLPMDIRAEGVKATLKNGILELTLPKVAPVKKVHVEVKTA